MGSFHSKANNSLLYSPPETRVTNYVNVEFFCLLSAKQWDFDDRTSNVYLRFAANAMGTFTTCHGPMSPSNSGNNKRLLFMVALLCGVKNTLSIIGLCGTTSYNYSS